MARKRKWKKVRPAELTEDQILKWADAYHRLTGRWPKVGTRPRAVRGAPAESWLGIDAALRQGCRGLPGGSSLARLLAARRGVRNRAALPRLTVGQILKWADEHHDRTGRWPSGYIGPQVVPGAPGERWSAINTALEHGRRGLPGGSSLAGLLAARRGVRNPAALPRLTVAQILRWADEFRRRTGTWPTAKCRPNAVPGAPGERWLHIDNALHAGHRGLPGGSSLARLLAAERGRRNRSALPPLTVQQVLKWADDFHRRTGRWPHHDSSPQTIPGSGGETWNGADNALRAGIRGLPAGSSLARVLAEHRGVRNTSDLPPLTVRQILRWADERHERTGQWPKLKDWREPIPGSLGETWGNVIQAVQKGLRGLPGTFTLSDLLAEHRGVRNKARLPPLTVRQVLAWADAFHARTGRWPTRDGPPQAIEGTAGEQWRNVDAALRQGLRGFPGGSSLAIVLARHRGVPNLAVPMKYRMAGGRR